MVDIHKSEMMFNINRPIPLPLLVMVVTRFLDESSVVSRDSHKKTVGTMMPDRLHIHTFILDQYRQFTKGEEIMRVTQSLFIP